MKVKPTRNKGEVMLQLNRRDDAVLQSAARGAVASPLRVRQILVPIDFSECSKRALQYALPLAKEQGAALTLLYVIPPVYGTGEYEVINYAQLEATMRHAAEEGMAKMVSDEIRDEVPALTKVCVGSPAREIVEMARSLPADLVVISTHGRTGLKHVFLGSVAEHVVQRAPCPVLVVRERESERTLC